MSQHVVETCNESNGLWLPLTEYAVKSGVSLSTIRRKIKSHSIQYRLEKGRYLILFQPSDFLAPRIAVPIKPEPPRPEPLKEVVQRSPEREVKIPEDHWALPAVERAVRMVSEAFEHTLKEKDERIRLLEQRSEELEERVNELRLLVRVLEEKYEVRY
jgi:hypothetical protein